MKSPLLVDDFLMFTAIFGYGPGSGSETLELQIRIRQKFRLLADPDHQHLLYDKFMKI
jgi:hypothetical protein